MFPDLQRFRLFSGRRIAADLNIILIQDSLTDTQHAASHQCAIDGTFCWGGRRSSGRGARCMPCAGCRSRCRSSTVQTLWSWVWAAGRSTSSDAPLFLVASLLLAVRPGAPSSILAASGDALCS